MFVSPAGDRHQGLARFQSQKPLNLSASRRGQVTGCNLGDNGVAVSAPSEKLGGQKESKSEQET